VKRFAIAALAALIAALAVVGGAGTAPSQTTSLTIYSGRDRVLVEPVMTEFTRQTGIELNIRYASSATLATALVEEGSNTPADVFWSTEPGTLGLVAARGLLKKLPQATVNKVAARFSTRSKRWVGTSARSRVLVYNTNLLRPAQLPRTIWGLTNAKWKDKIGLAPTNGSFQAFLGAAIHLEGENRMRTWLRGIRNNQPKTYPSNTTVVEAVARGDVAVGLVNHYYLHNVLANTPGLPIKNHWFQAGDPGALVLAAGAGITTSSQKGATAQRFIDFLHSRWAQRFIAHGPGAAEYPVLKSVQPRAGLPKLAEIKGPKYSLGRLSTDLPKAVRLLLEVGLIR
jgi:iron(III) transport system substrate-binding protein